MSESDFLDYCDENKEENYFNNFYGVYLMVSLNPQEKNKTYIGFTNNPENRIKRHNGKGGAKVTHGRGPWQMILIIHGFPNEIYALKFEWAWQSPEKSRRLKAIEPKQKGEKALAYRLRLLAHILRLGPWWRLGLTIRWLCPQFEQPFPIHLQPPGHMPIAHGALSLKKPPPTSTQTEKSIDTHCSICHNQLDDNQSVVSCLNDRCCARWHLECIGESFISNSNSSTSVDSGFSGRYLLPIEGPCVLCGVILVWSRLVENVTFQSARVKNKTAP